MCDVIEFLNFGDLSALPFIVMLPRLFGHQIDAFLMILKTPSFLFKHDVINDYSPFSGMLDCRATQSKLAKKFSRPIFS